MEGAIQNREFRGLRLADQGGGADKLRRVNEKLRKLLDELEAFGFGDDEAIVKVVADLVKSGKIKANEIGWEEDKGHDGDGEEEEI